MTQFADELEPVRKAPSLFTLNTFGFKLYGKSDYDRETDSFMTTHSFRFLGKGKFRRFEMVHLALFAGVVLYLIATAGLE
jgi:hypothetical protein